MKPLIRRVALSIILFTNSLSPVKSQTRPSPMPTQLTPMETCVIRLKPGQDLKKEIMQWANTQKIKAGCVVTCVGSLQEANLRFANQPEATLLPRKYEIVSLVGTFSEDAAHLHLSISDSTGATIGGHLMDGNVVYTTVELVLGIMPGLEFAREVDSTFGYKELVVRKKKK